MNPWPLVLAIFSSFLLVEPAKILGIFHYPSKSHHILASRLLKSLSERGHQVTMVSPYPFTEKIPNYRDIFLEEALQFKEDSLSGFIAHNATRMDRFSATQRIGPRLIEIVLRHPEVQGLKSESFDLVIQLPFMADTLLGLGDHFKAPVIVFSTVLSMSLLDKYTGNTSPPSFVPTMAFPVSSTMNFWERTFNFLAYVTFSSFLDLFQDAEQERLLQEYFPTAPDMGVLVKNVSLVFVNSHYSIESPRPYVPNVIQVGGLHVEDPKELPEDLKNFLDGASEGAIFFSLGSNVKISSLPSGTVEAIIKALGKQQMKVLFKSDLSLENLPENFKTGQWLPQNDILAHPNVKLFISHGGLLSTIEAVHHAVPIIGIPVFADQHSNIADAVVNGYAVKVDINRLTEEEFSQAIAEILSDRKYRDNIGLKSSLLRDQPMKPLDRAVYWVEHVLRYKGGAHLKNSGIYLTTYQYYLLDVILFLLVVISLGLFASYLVLRRLLRRGVSVFFRRKVKDQ